MFRFGASSLAPQETRSRSNSGASDIGRYSTEYELYSPTESDDEDIIASPEVDHLANLFNSFRHLGSLPFQLPDLRNTVLSTNALMRNFSDEDEDDDPSSVCYVTTKTIASSIGPNGRPHYIEKTKTTRRASGISEIQKSIRDSISGVEKLKIKRTLGHKGRTLVRERLSDGRERSHEDLKNIQSGEADLFDEQWRREAQRSLIDMGPSDDEDELEYEIPQTHRSSSRQSLPPLQSRRHGSLGRSSSESTVRTSTRPPSSQRRHY